MEEPTQTPTDTPVAQPTPNDTPVEAPVQAPPETPEPTQPLTTPSEPASPADPQASPAVVEDEYQTYQQIPNVPPIDFSQLPVDENNLIDPNALAQQINSRIAQAENNALARAQQVYAENEQEKRLWEKAYEKHPELKDNKELQDLVQNARMGKVTEILSTTNDPSQVKLPTPAQMADTLFKFTAAKKEEGFNQATQNTVVQQSAVLETSGKPGNADAENLDQLQKNINNPNKEVRDKARNALLRKKLGWE